MADIHVFCVMLRGSCTDYFLFCRKENKKILAAILGDTPIYIDVCLFEDLVSSNGDLALLKAK